MSQLSRLFCGKGDLLGVKKLALFLFKRHYRFIMKKLLFLVLFFSGFSSLGHFYLAKRAYQLKVGEAQASKICNIGENISCDSALLSDYAEIFGISLSNFGLSFNFVLFFMAIFFLWMGAGPYWKNIAFYLAGVIAVSSIVMAGISLAESLFCPICWALYLFSFLAWVCLFFAFKPELLSLRSFFKQNIKEKSSYIFAASLILAGLFFHINFINVFDIKSQEEMLSAVFIDWQNEKAQALAQKSLLQKGNPDSKMRIVEFADFLCPACKIVQPALQNFLKYFPDVSFQFYVYPLDGACNPGLKLSGSGLSCELSKAVLCSKNKGWLAHDFFFKKQNHFIKSQGNKDKIKSLFKDLLAQTGIDKKKFDQCMQDPATLEKVKQSATAGGKARIQGTPTFFINEKKIQYQSPKLIILKKAYDHLK